MSLQMWQEYTNFGRKDECGLKCHLVLMNQDVIGVCCYHKLKADMYEIYGL